MLSSKAAEQRAVERLRGGEVAAERLFDDHASAVRAARLAAADRRRPRTAWAGWRDSTPGAGRTRAVRGAPGTSPGPGSRHRRSAAGCTASRTPRDRARRAARRCPARGRGAVRRVQPAFATPMTGTSRWPRLTIACSAGKIFLYARSPVAPKNTNASEWTSLIATVPRPLTASRGVRRTRSASPTTAVGELRLAARTEALIEGSGQDGHGNRLVDGGVDRPPPFTRIGHAAREIRQPGILDEGSRRQVEQPGRDHAAAAPQLGDVAKVEVVLVVLGVPQRRRLGIDGARSPSNVGGAQHAQPFGVGGHDAVLDPVVHHLDEMAGAVRSAVQIPPFGGAADALSPRRAWDVADAGRQRREDRIEVLDDIRLATDHQAVAAFPSPDAAAGPDVDVVDATPGELLRAPDVVDVVGIAAVDEDVTTSKGAGAGRRSWRRRPRPEPSTRRPAAS